MGDADAAPSLLVFIATIAAGGGDLAFARAAITALAAAARQHNTTVAYCLVAQAGRDPALLAPALAALPAPGAAPSLGCFRRGSGDSAAAAAAGAPPPPPRPPQLRALAVRALIPGPLHL